MKKLFQVSVVALLTFTFAFSSLAQKQKSKDDYFKEIATLSNTKKPEDLEKAYQLAKEFLVNYPKEKSDNANKLKNWVKDYRENKFYKSIEAKSYAEAFALGKEILTDEPENTSVTLHLTYGGFDSMATKKDKSFADDTIKYAKQTLDLLEKGSFPKTFSPFTSKDEAIAWMYYIIANFSQEKDVKEAAVNYYKATLYETQIKKSSQPYYVIAVYYEDAYQKASTDLKAKSKNMSDAEFKTESEKVDKLIDQMLDAYARAYTLGVAEKNPSAPAWKQRLAQVYEFRKKTSAGLDAFITYVSSTPLADPSKF